MQHALVVSLIGFFGSWAIVLGQSCYNTIHYSTNCYSTIYYCSIYTIVIVFSRYKMQEKQIQTKFSLYTQFG